MRKVLPMFSCLWMFAAAPLWAQGVLVITNEDVRLPRPIPHLVQAPAAYAIEEFSVDARLKGQQADVQVTQIFRNTGSSVIQAQFVFPLPYDGAIDSMTLIVNGKELPAELLSAGQARDRYQSIVRAQKDPALLEWIGTGMFQTSVFPIPPGETRTVSIHYSQLLRKDHDLTEFLFPLSTAKFTSHPIQKVRVQLSIESESNIKNIYSPTHEVLIKRPTAKQATVSYTAENVSSATDFRLFYDSQAGEVSTTLLSYRPDKDEDGYFLLLASPEIQTNKSRRQSKTVVFVVDKSGSMSGEKIEQAREAAKFILNNLHEGDMFNIVSYDSVVQSFRPELERFTPETRQAALAYVDGLYAGGGTNIQEALTSALKNFQDSDLPGYLLFMTDGRPTSGQTNEAKISAAVQAANRVRTRVLSFGVGFDVNGRLLDRISSGNHGLSEYVRPDEDIEAHVSKVFNRISSPVMTGVSIGYEFDKSRNGDPVNRIYPGDEIDLFEGEQLVIVGRYRHFGSAKITLTGKVQGKEKTLDFSGKFVKQSKDATNTFIEKLWATRRIGEIIDELDLHGKNPELVEELVMLSTKHGILTPYTSFLADETVRPELASAGNRQRALSSLSQIDELSGRGGFLQRDIKLQFKNAQNSAADISESLSELSVTQPARSLGNPGSPARPGNNLGGVPNVGGVPVNNNIAFSAQGQLEPAKMKQVVRRAGAQTLYQRGKLLVSPETASLDLNKPEDKSKVVEIERFSQPYFDLTNANSPAENELLSLQKDGEELLIKLRGEIYLIK